MVSARAVRLSAAAASFDVCLTGSTMVSTPAKKAPFTPCMSCTKPNAHARMEAIAASVPSTVREVPNQR